MSASMVELRARLYLMRAAEPPGPCLGRFVAECGVVEAADAVRAGTAPPEVMAEAARPEADVDGDVALVESGQARVLTPQDEDWPSERLDALAVAGLGVPLGLWVRGSGSLEELTRSAVTVTGSREAGGYGNHVASEFSHALARSGVTVVNGGGGGIEWSAVRAALVAGGLVVVVLPCGIDWVHPRGHEGLFASVVQRGGLLVSEYPVGAAPARHRIRARRRLLAAMSGGDGGGGVPGA